MKFDEISKDLVTAMKEKNKNKKDAISSLKDAIKKVAIDNGTRDNIDDELVNKVVFKEIKSYEEQIATCPKDRTDLLEVFNERLSYIKAYAPKLLSKEEIMKILDDKFKEVIESKNKGQIMKSIMPEFKGKADGKLINEIIEELCK